MVRPESQSLQGGVTLVQEQYASTCQRHGCHPDVTISCELGKHSNRVDVADETQLLVLLDLLVLEQVPFLTHVYISTKKLQTSAIEAVATFLQSANPHVTHLSLSHNKIGDLGVGILFNALSLSAPSALTALMLCDVGMTEKGAKALAEMLPSKSLSPLSFIDLSNNFANQSGVLALERAAKLHNMTDEPPIKLDLTGNLIVVELLNAITHGVGAGGALFGGALMTMRAIKHGLPAMSVLALVIFIMSLFTLMTSSCVYHSCFRKPKASKRFRKADHCSIFVLIAGTYTPFVVCYTLDPPTVAGPVTLLLVWLCATAGIVMSLGSPESNRLRALFALATGWLGAFSVRTMLERMQTGALSSVVLGGVTYSVGIVFYLLGKKIPSMHVVWHVAVMIGGGFHYFALWRYVVNV